ncbi:MAG: hypothetical protein ACTHM2_05060 [Afipia sp.]|jgi:hypothetical protein
MAAKQAISERAARFRATFGATLFFGHGTEPPQARSSKYKTIDMGTRIAAELLERGVRAGWSGLEWLEELALPEPALAELLLHIISAKAASGTSVRRDGLMNSRIGSHLLLKQALSGRAGGIVARRMDRRARAAQPDSDGPKTEKSRS